MPNLVGTGLNQVPTNGMLGGLAYQSPDHASIKDLDLKNLSQINSEIADTAVDIFIYDTSKDSDGGAWRHRTSHTSWYNEELNTTTRGSRKEFPVVAVIVAEGYKLTIYDGDDPDLPMWMVFNRGTDSEPTMWWDGNNGNAATAITALNGLLMLSTTSAGSYGADFIGERWIYFYNGQTNSGFRHNGGGLVNRNSAVSSRTVIEQFSGYALASQHRDVAMTVLPNAPIDNVTQLPRPTILIGQDDGLSIIKDDYNVVERQNTWNNDGGVWEVQFDEEHGGYWYSAAYYRESHGTYPNHGLVVGYEPDITATSTLSQANGNYQDRIHLSQGTSTTNLPGGYWNANHIPDFWFISSNGNANGGKVTFTNQGEYFGTQYGLTLFDGAYETIGSTTRSSLGCYINSEYNTGWMHGDIKGAFLSDTDATNVTGTELITNGDFSSALGSEWVANGSGTNTFSIVSGELQVVRASGTSLGNAEPYQQFTTEVGKVYTIKVTTTSGDMAYLCGTSIAGTQYFNITTSTAGTTYSRTFTATSTTGYILIIPNAAGTTAATDNISLRLADPDRSVNNNGLQVFGTITKSAVATGAELVAYSGFGVGNYLQQPYNSDLNFGTGDFFLNIWLNPSSTSSEQYIIDKRSGGVDIFELRLLSGGTLRLYVMVSSAVAYYDSSSSLPLNTWSLVQLVRPTGGDLSIYINGVESTNKAYNSFIGQSLTTSSPVTLGLQVDSNGSPATNLKMSLLRISTSAPSAEQIKKMYEDEKVLFQENAACTLYGSSDAVTALAYDEVTERLHVGTSSGRSEFQGLRRINNTTTAVTTAISAYDSFVVEQ